MDSYKSGLAEAKKSLDDVQKKVRELESMLSAKDRIINDLRLQVKCRSSKYVGSETPERSMVGCFIHCFLVKSSFSAF